MVSQAICIVAPVSDLENAIENAAKAAEAGIKVYTIGIGSPEGVPIPVFNSAGRKDFRRDQEGNVVITKLNETMMTQLAARGEGIYVKANNVTAALKLVFDKINELEKAEFEKAKVADYESWYQIPLAIVLFLLIIEFILLPRKNKRISSANIFNLKV